MPGPLGPGGEEDEVSLFLHTQIRFRVLDAEHLHEKRFVDSSLAAIIASFAMSHVYRNNGRLSVVTWYTFAGVILVLSLKKVDYEYYNHIETFEDEVMGILYPSVITHVFLISPLGIRQKENGV